MNSPSAPVTSLATLMSALSGAAPRNLDLQTSVACPYSITLPPGFSLTGRDKNRCVLSFSNGDGVGLTANNQVSGITIIAMPSVRAIYTQAGISDMGTIALSDLAVTGQVSILTRAGTDNLNLACDSRRYSEQPQKYGVNVYQGALTVYNFNGDANSRLNASLTNVTVGANSSTGGPGSSSATAAMSVNRSSLCSASSCSACPSARLPAPSHRASPKAIVTRPPP
jgi:hypothetical protein